MLLVYFIIAFVTYSLNDTYRQLYCTLYSHSHMHALWCIGFLTRGSV